MDEVRARVIQRFREYVPVVQHDLVKFLAYYRAEWRKASLFGVTDYEGITRLLEILPDEWRPWARSRSVSYVFRQRHSGMLVGHFTVFFSEVMFQACLDGHPPPGPYPEVTSYPVLHAPSVNPVPEGVPPPPGMPTPPDHTYEAGPSRPAGQPADLPPSPPAAQPLEHIPSPAMSPLPAFLADSPIEEEEEAAAAYAVPPVADPVDDAQHVIEISSSEESEDAADVAEEVVSSDGDVQSIIAVPDDTVVIDSDDDDDDNPDEGSVALGDD